MSEDQTVILEDQLLDHLATDAGARVIWQERLSPAVIEDGDQEIRNVLQFVLDWMDRHRTPPGAKVLTDEFGLQFLEPETPVEYIIEKLRERYQNNTIWDALDRTARKAQDDPGEAVDVAMSEFSQIRMATMSRGHIDDGSAPTLLENYQRDKMEGAGISFGFPQVDEDLGGLKLGRMVCIAAALKRYKSWLLFWSAFQSWLDGRDVDFYTLELSTEEMTERMICALANVSWARYNKRDLHEDEWLRVQDAIHTRMEAENKLRFLQPPFGERTMQHMLQMTGQSERPVAAIYIDQFYNIENGRPVPNSVADWKRSEMVVDELMVGAAEFPLYFAAQLNRDAGSLNEMADATKVGLTYAIPQKVDMLLGVYQNKDMQAQRIMEFGVIESRNTQLMRYELKAWLGAAPKKDYFQFLNRKDVT